MSWSGDGAQVEPGGALGPICLHPYPINIVSDSIHSVFVLKKI